jgi:SAM-dependent methyltransferase
VQAQLDYGNWIRKKNLYILGLCIIGVAALNFIPLGFLYHLVITILSGILLVSLLFPLYAYVMFSQSGGKFQDKIYTLIIQSLGPTVKGRVLDIGSGNGVLAVRLAQQHVEVEVLGIDYWGKNWEYSKSVCEKNARAVQVDRRVHFQKGNAAALNFALDTFDGVISNLTFHEVQSMTDKREVMREALRVLKPGGKFAFIDYFYDAKYYGKALEFGNILRSLNLAQVECKPLRDVVAVPLLLRHPNALGKVGIVCGQK